MGGPGPTYNLVFDPFTLLLAGVPLSPRCLNVLAVLLTFHGYSI